MKGYLIKTFLLIPALIGGVLVSHAEESDSLGMIGDNLDLNAVLETFRTAESIEKFETSINSPENKINNLDLNEDDLIDYIQVIDNVEGDAHALILRIDISEDESQDVAVIELEKTGPENAAIQIVGDEDIYGEDYIVEPLSSVATGNMPPAFVVLNVWHWNSVGFIFAPTYKPWRSPWRWGNYPKTWKSRKPYGWRTYHNFHKGRHHRYHVVHVHRVGNAHAVYHKHRKTSQRIKRHRHYHKHKNHNGNKKHNGQHKKNKKSHKKGHKNHKH
ncbi:MAG: hypothetical protein GQ574_27990 [Crocinitomix sp.]|nr:hypothetical protein [Crocinitomix sp.]